MYEFIIVKYWNMYIAKFKEDDHLGYDDLLQKKKEQLKI